MNLPKLAVSKPTTVLIIFVVLAIIGVYTAFQIPVDLMPDIEIPYIGVITSYTGAGPEEVERTVTRSLESTLTSVTGLKTLHSTSSMGQSMIFLELTYGSNIDAAAVEVRDRIDMVRAYLPEDAGTPTIMKMDPSMIPLMFLVLSGNRTPEELHAYAEDVLQPRLEQVDGIASVSIMGGRAKAIRVDIPRDRLEAYSLTITQITQMITAQNMQITGGTITEGEKNYTLTTTGQYQSLDDIRDTVISYKAVQAGLSPIPVMRTIRLRDIADVYEGYKTVDTIAYVNGEPCVMMSVQKQSGKNSVQTSANARRQLEQLIGKPFRYPTFWTKLFPARLASQGLLPDDVTLQIAFDTTDMIRTSISNIVSSVLQGAILAVVILLIFLRSVKSTIIIAITIPLSLIITLTLMYFCGISLNMMSIAGLALGVGMLVDNSIVILENIFSYRERGAKAAVAAVLGSHEMLMAITASTLTTVCVFLPLIMLQSRLGMIGQFFNALTFTVVFSLLSSLVVAVFLVPVLSSKYLKLEGVGRRVGGDSKLNRAMTRFFERLDTGYATAVRFALAHKIALCLTIIGMFFGSLALVISGKVGFVFMPSQGSDQVSINVELPKGTRIEVTEDLLRQIEQIVIKEVKGVQISWLSISSTASMMGGGSANSGSVEFQLYPRRERRANGYDDADSAKEKLRAYFSQFPGATLSFGSGGMMMGGGSSGVDVVIKSDDLNLARETANNIVAVLKEQAADYVTEPTSSLEDGLPQVDIVLARDRLYNLGLNVYGVGNEVRANINGLTAGRYQDAGKEIDIVVALDEKDRTHLDDLSGIFVNNASGQRIPVSNFANYRESTSPVSISRENQSRIVHITATPKQFTTDANGKRTMLSLGTVQQAVERVIAENIPYDEDVNITYAGDSQQFWDNIQTFFVIVCMAILLVFAVMASQFESFGSPFIVLFCIPLSFIGIVLMHLILGETLSVITAVGFLVLVGIIVNNGIVLVDYTNLLQKRGLALADACVEAAKNRLRPILMTTLTTVLGLLPMAFFPGDGSEMTQPIGKTVLSGLSFGTLMTLFLIPVLYYIFNRAQAKARLKKLARATRRAQKKEARNG